MRKVVGIALLAAACLAHANVVVLFSESPTTVKVTASGSLDTSSMIFVVTGNLPSGENMVPSVGGLSLRPPTSNGTRYKLPNFHMQAFGTYNGFVFGTNLGPDQFGCFPNGAETQFTVPANYVSGTPFQAGTLFPTSFAAMGVTSMADVVNTLPGGQTITYRFETVPEPATLAALGLGAAALLRRRKK